METFDRLQICVRCKHKAFDKAEGVICGLTNALPQHPSVCPDFAEEVRERYIEFVKERNGETLLERRKYRLFHFLIDYPMAFALIWLLYYVCNDSGWFFIYEFNEILVAALVFFLYFFLTEAIFQRSPAKFLTYSFVVNDRGMKPDISAIMIRSLLRLIPFDFISFMNSKRNGWHDRFSKTQVVRRYVSDSGEVIDEWDIKS